FAPLHQLGARIISSNTYHGFGSQQYQAATGLHVVPPSTLQSIGAGTAWTESTVQTTIATPYGGPNNNVRFIQAFIEGFRRRPGSSYHPGGVRLPQRYQSGLIYEPPTAGP